MAVEAALALCLALVGMGRWSPDDVEAALNARDRAQLHQHQFALDMLALRHILDAYHVDQLVELVDDLLDD